MIKAFIFDLDGTLVDTLDDLAGFMNGFLADHGWPVHETAEYRFLVGRGLSHLIKNSIPPGTICDFGALYDEALVRYHAMGSGASKPYPGAVETLADLNSRGIPVAVVTNKPEDVAIRLMPDLFPGIAFALIVGGRDTLPAKPDPAGALEAATAMGAAPNECVFVGDSDVDMHTAKAAGMLPVGAAWGFRGEKELRDAGAGLIVHSMLELRPLYARDRDRP